MALASITRTLSVSLLTATLLSSAAFAQQAQPTRIRGTIESVNGTTLMIKAREGDEKKVTVTDNVMVTGIVKATMADIKPNTYVGVAAMPMADGVQKAASVLIFPEAMRGTGEGFRPWDLRANSTMTNATVDQKVEANDGQTLMVKYKDGEKKITVTPDTPIVTFVPSTKAELKAGAKVIIMGATKAADGSFETNRINVGLDGVTPPM